MKWLALVLALAVCRGVARAGVGAKVPCRNQIYNDWEQDGQIASTYPLACYRDASASRAERRQQIYTSLEDDIRAAMQAAIARSHGKKVAAQVGHRFVRRASTDPRR